MRKFLWLVILAGGLGGGLLLLSGRGDTQMKVDVAPPIISGSVPEQDSIPEATLPPVKVGFVGVLQAVGESGWLVQTAEGTKNVLVGESPDTVQVQAGDKLGIWAVETAQGLVAVEITVIPQTPQRMHYLGQVISVSADRIGVTGQQGETTSFRMDMTLQKLPESYQPAVGDTVTIVAKPDPIFDGWLAVAIAAR